MKPVCIKKHHKCPNVARLVPKPMTVHLIDGGWHFRCLHETPQLIGAEVGHSNATGKASCVHSLHLLEKQTNINVEITISNSV